MPRLMLSDDQYERIRPLLPGKDPDPGRTAADTQRFVEAILGIARTGSPWRDLPPDFGLWNSVYKRFARWSQAERFISMRRSSQKTVTRRLVVLGEIHALVDGLGMLARFSLTLAAK